MYVYRGLLSIKRMDRVPNKQIGELCRARKGLDEKIDEGVLWWFGNPIAKKDYVGECAGKCSMGKPR